MQDEFVNVEQGVAEQEAQTQSLISILFKSGNRSELWYTHFTTEVRDGKVYSLSYALADEARKNHHISLDQIEMVTVKQTKPL